MATPRGAIPRDLEQRFRDLEEKVRTLTGTALRRAQLGVTSGDFAVSGGGNVVVQDGGSVRVEGGELTITYPDGANALRAWRDSDGAMTLMVLAEDGSLVFEVSTNATGSDVSAGSRTIYLDAVDQATLGWRGTHSVVCGSGGTNVNGNLTVNGDLHGSRVFADAPDTTSNAANVRMPSGGQLQRVTSSLRYKQDVEDAPDQAEAFLSVTGRTWRDRAEVAEDPDTTERHIGYIAEELDEAGLTAYVTYDDQGRPDAIQYDRLTVPLLHIAKQQRDQIDSLTRRLEQLEERMAG